MSDDAVATDASQMSTVEERNTETFSDNCATGIDTAEFPVTSEMIAHHLGTAQDRLLPNGLLPVTGSVIKGDGRMVQCNAPHTSIMATEGYGEMASFNAECGLMRMQPDAIAAAHSERQRAAELREAIAAMQPEFIAAAYAIERATHLRQIQELEVERDDARAMLRQRTGELRDAAEAMSRCKRDREGWAELGARQAEAINRLMDERQRVAVAEPGDHPYHGPLGAPDDKGQRRAVADPVHERFHQSVGDILAGKVLPAARKQMAEALRRKAPDAPTSASTSKPMPDKAVASFGDPRRIGG
jgi:hypothetical protein